MEYVIPGLVVLIVIMLVVLAANASRLRRSGLTMRAEIDRIRRENTQRLPPPAPAPVAQPVPVAAPPAPPPAARPVPAAAPPPPPKPPAPPPAAARPVPVAAPPPPPKTPAPPPPARTAPTARPAAPAPAPSGLLFESLVKDYNDNPNEIRRRFKVRDFSVANMPALSNNPGVKPVYRFVQPGQGEYWLVPLGEGVGYALPRFRPAYVPAHFRLTGLDRVFVCNGFVEGQTYQKLEVVKPAVFRVAANDDLELSTQGILELRAAENQPVAVAAPPPAEPAAPSAETTDIAVRYQANTERLYSDLNGLRVSVTNLDALNQNQAAPPVFLPNTDGAFWVLGGRFLVPRPGSMDNLPQMRPSPMRFFDCTAEGPGEPPQKNTLVRAALVRMADDGWMLLERGAIRLAAAETDRQHATEEIVRLYRSDTEGLQNRYTVFQFGVTNASELEANPAASPRFGLLATGPFWLLQRGARIRYAVPAPDLAIDDRLIRSSAFLALFNVTHYQTGQTYPKVDLVRPARMEQWDVAETGEVSFAPPEPEPPPPPPPDAAPKPARRAKPKKEEAAGEPPPAGVPATQVEMTEIYNQDPGLFRERFAPTRFGVRNARELESQARAEPLFGPKRNGDYWLVAAAPGSNPGHSSAVPYPGIEVDAATYRHLKKVFKCMGYQAGRRYRGVRLVSPALVTEMPPEGWNIVKTGVIALTGGEPDVDLD